MHTVTNTSPARWGFYASSGRVSPLAQPVRNPSEEPTFPVVYFFTASMPFRSRGNCLLRIVHKVLNFAKFPEGWQANNAIDMGC
jgi:hypothetical protein